MPKITTLLRKTIIKRANGCCEYCHSQAQFATQAFSVEHIKPQSKGGKTTLDNLALACQGVIELLILLLYLVILYIFLVKLKKI